MTENKKKSEIWNNYFSTLFILFGTYSIAPMWLVIPFPIGLVFVTKDIYVKILTLESQSLGFVIGLASFIIAITVSIKFRKNDYKKTVGLLFVSIILYLSWLLIVFEVCQILKNSEGFLEIFLIHLVSSAPFQISSFIIFKKTVKGIKLLRVPCSSP